MIDAQGQVPEGAPSSGGSGSPPRSDRVTSPAARVACSSARPQLLDEFPFARWETLG
jgi:hypothetical protein